MADVKKTCGVWKLDGFMGVRRVRCVAVRIYCDCMQAKFPCCGEDSYCNFASKIR